MHKRSLLLLGALAASCAHESPRPRRALAPSSVAQVAEPQASEPESTPVPAAQELPIPEPLKPKIERVAQVGRDLYLQEKAAGLGVTAVEAQYGTLEGKGLRGYLAQRETDTSGRPLDHFVVTFFTASEEPQVRYRVRVDPETGRDARVESLEPPEALNPRLLPLVRARITALAAAPAVKLATPVVLPGSSTGEDDVVVYLLNHSERGDIAIMGPHRRIVLSADGTQVKSTGTVGQAGEEMVGADDWPIGVSHDGDTPSEIHVYLSLLHRVRFFVGTPSGRWHVNGDRITLDSTETTAR